MPEIRIEGKRIAEASGDLFGHAYLVYVGDGGTERAIRARPDHDASMPASTGAKQATGRSKSKTRNPSERIAHIVALALLCVGCDSPSRSQDAQQNPSSPASMPRISPSAHDLAFNRGDSALLDMRPLSGEEVRGIIIGRSISEDAQKTGRAPYPQSEHFGSEGTVRVILDNTSDKRPFGIFGDSLCVRVISVNKIECRKFYRGKDGQLFQVFSHREGMPIPVRSW